MIINYAIPRLEVYKVSTLNNYELYCTLLEKEGKKFNFLLIIHYATSYLKRI